MFDCMGCGQSNCYHNETFCKECLNRTTRTITVPRSDFIGAPRASDFLEPGESVHSTYDDPNTGDVHITIRKSVN